MSGLNVDKVNVIVAGVSFESDKENTDNNQSEQ